MTVPDKMMNPAANMETRTDDELERALARVLAYASGELLNEAEVTRRPMKQIPSSVSGLRRALELWPYVFVAVSVVGLTYIALSDAR